MILTFLGDVIRLVDATTGVSTPNLFLRKIEGKHIQLAPQATKEVVAQLQPAALQFCDSENSYFGFGLNGMVKKRVRHF